MRGLWGEQNPRSQGLHLGEARLLCDVGPVPVLSREWGGWMVLLKARRVSSGRHTCNMALAGPYPSRAQTVFEWAG